MKSLQIHTKIQKILYVEMLKALYAMLKASILYYNKFRRDIEAEGYTINPYDPCVANKVVNKKQHTLTWHVDDVKSSHVESRANDEFHKWYERKYGREDNGHVKVTRVPKHDYLAINLDYSEDRKMKVDMLDYIERTLKDF